MNFWKSSRGGVIFNPKIYIARFGNLKQGAMSMKLIQKSNFRVQGMFFLTHFEHQTRHLVLIWTFQPGMKSRKKLMKCLFSKKSSDLVQPPFPRHSFVAIKTAKTVKSEPSLIKTLFPLDEIASFSCSRIRAFITWELFISNSDLEIQIFHNNEIRLI